MVWMDNVFIPRSRVFTGEALNRNQRQSLVCWLLWHHSYGWLAKAELTLAIALALAEVMGLKNNPQTVEQLKELTVQRADLAQLHDCRRAGPGNDDKRPSPSQSASCGLRGHQHHESPATNG